MSFSVRRCAMRFAVMPPAAVFAATLAAVALILLWSSGPVAAQTIRDTVRQHVAEGLERPKPKPKAKPKKKRSKPSSKAVEGPDTQLGSAAAAPVASDVPEPAVAANPERLPKRVFGKNFELDAKLGSGVRGWYPDQ